MQYIFLLPRYISEVASEGYIHTLKYRSAQHVQHFNLNYDSGKLKNSRIIKTHYSTVDLDT